MRPYGQHFLHDRNILDKILALAGVADGDRVLEIGPGEGALTAPLLDRDCHVLAVEIDAGLVPGLRAKFGTLQNFELLEIDALDGKHQLAPALVDRLGKFDDYVLVSNLPYSAGTPILMNLWQSDVPPTRGLVMLQKEVGDRLVACEGGKDYGTLSVLMANRARCRLVGKIAPGCFSPPPKVDSCLVEIETIPLQVPWDPLRELVREGFSQRRKQLNRLKKSGWDLETAQIEASQRPGDLSPEMWFKLSQTVKIR